jgi:hypothetical protein
VSGDEIAGAWDAKRVAAEVAGSTFTLPKRSRGRIQLAGLPEKVSKLDAIFIWIKASPPDRVDQRTTPGSPAPHGEAPKPPVSAKSPLARTVR